MNSLFYDEFKQIGVDYDDHSKVEKYDKEMSFRDFKREALDIIKNIGLTNEHTVIDFGTGTGNFAIEAAKRCKKVYAIDISKAMLSRAEAKAKEQNIDNIIFVNSGFLNYQHQGELVDAVVTDVALHHLPDFWKQIALLRINQVLKPGGSFYLADQIYTFNYEEYEEKLKAWVEFNWKRSEDPNFMRDVETSIREEFATYEWIIDTMLEKAGFTYRKNFRSDCFVTYYCTKVD